MNRIFLSLLLATACLSSTATDFHGLISTNTTWTKANSPYYITDHTLVDTGATLTVEPGVIIKIAKGVNFYVKGNIYAVGTVTDSIYFNGYDNANWRNAWNGIALTGTVNKKVNATFGYCLISRATQALYVENANLAVTNSTFFRDDQGVYLNHGQAIVTGNKFIEVTPGAFWADQYAGQDIYADVINNEFDLSSVFVGAPAGGFFGTINIDGNYMHGKNSQMTVLHAKNVSIKNNLILNCRTGLSVQWSSFLDKPFTHNLIANCDLGAYINDIHGSITNNTFKLNKTAVQLGFSAPFVFENNCFDSNSFNVQAVSSTTYTLSNNWWGSTDSAAIEAKMYDYDQDFKSGHIYFMPLLTQADTSCQSVPQVQWPTSVPDVQVNEISVYPNPFTGFFTIKTQGINNISSITVYNLFGAKVASVTHPQDSDIKIDMSQQATGIYIYKLAYNNGNIISGKLYKQ